MYSRATLRTAAAHAVKAKAIILYLRASNGTSCANGRHPLGEPPVWQIDRHSCHASGSQESSQPSQTANSQQLVELQDAVEHVRERIHRLRGSRLRGLHRGEDAGEHEARVHRAVWDVQLADRGVVR